MYCLCLQHRSTTTNLFCCLFHFADSPQEEGKPKRKLNFRRLLLNKCQEEFEKGDAAMLAVAEREAKKGQGGEEEEQVKRCVAQGFRFIGLYRVLGSVRI
jgi:translation initiation factor 4G